MKTDEAIRCLQAVKDELMTRHMAFEGHVSAPVSAIDMAIQALKEQPEWAGPVGGTCYKIYITAERTRFPGTFWDYFVDTKQCLAFWKRHISLGGEGILYVRERPFTRSDKQKLGRTVFWTKEEAEEAIGIERSGEA